MFSVSSLREIEIWKDIDLHIYQLHDSVKHWHVYYRQYGLSRFIEKVLKRNAPSNEAHTTGASAHTLWHRMLKPYIKVYLVLNNNCRERHKN